MLCEVFSLCYVRFLVCVMCLFLVCVMCLFLAWRASLRSAGARFARGGVPGWAEVHRHQPPRGGGTGGTTPPLATSMHCARGEDRERDKNTVCLASEGPRTISPRCLSLTLTLQIKVIAQSQESC